MQYNISPETLLDQRHPSVNVDKILSEEVTFEMFKDYAVCANGAMYRKDIKGFLPELMEKMYNERVIFKKKMIEAKKAFMKNRRRKRWKKKLPVATISKWQRRSLLTLLMVLSAISIFGILN